MENEQVQEENVNKSILRKRLELLTNDTPILAKASSRDRDRIFFKADSFHLKTFIKKDGFEGWIYPTFDDFQKDYDDFEIITGDMAPSTYYPYLVLRLVAVPIGEFIESPDGLTWEKKDEITYENITHGKLTQKEFVRKYNDFKIIED
ncbi:MAG: hypothetical protein V1779_01045 [bacterium]